MILSGNLSSVLALPELASLCAITACEADGEQATVISHAGQDGACRLELPPGTWCITLTPHGHAPHDTGLLDVTPSIPPGALDDYLRRISAGSHRIRPPVRPDPPGQAGSTERG